jgi:hypothetical protein
MKLLTAGSEIDAYCTKCRMDLGHRIVAMVAGVPKRVVCLTCGGEHAYRAPRTPTGPSPVLRRRDGEPVVAAKKAAPAGVRAAQRAKEEADRYGTWAAQTLGKAVDAFTRYSVDQKLTAGQLILHPKFGEGYVEGVREDDKVSVMFRDGRRTLAHRGR